MLGLSLFRPSRQSNISTSGEERFKYPFPRENKISQMPYPRDNKDNQIPTPCPASPPRRHYIDRCISVVAAVGVVSVVAVVGVVSVVAVVGVVSVVAVIGVVALVAVVDVVAVVCVIGVVWCSFVYLM